MENKRRALGRGLEELFNSESLELEKIEQRIIEESKDEIIEVDLNSLRSNPYQPRKKFDEESLKELSESIKEHGVFQPIIIKKSIRGYEIVAGERRVKASIIAGLEKIPAIIKDFSDEQMMQIALLENLQRENLTSIEEAGAYKEMIGIMNITQEELAKKIGKSRSHITNMLGLLNLPKSVQNLILENKISMGHARILSKLENQSQIEELANKIVLKNISVRELERIVNQDFKRKVEFKTKRTDEHEKYKYIEEVMKEKLGTTVYLQKNKLQIGYDSVADLIRILEILNIKIDD